MDAKAFLEQVKKLDKLIANKLEDQKQWDEIATSTTGQMGGDRVQSSGSQQKMADAVVKWLDIDKEIERLKQERQYVISVIEQLPLTEYEVLYDVYVKRRTLKEVASEQKMSYSWASHHHTKGVADVQAILDNRTV